MKKFALTLGVLFFSGIFVFASGNNQKGAASGGAQGITEFSAVFKKGTYNDDVEKMTLMKELEQKANVKINWVTIPETSWNERKNILINSGDMADVVYMGGFSTTERDQYGRQGVFLELTDAIKQYAPNYSKILADDPIFKATVTNAADGKMYSIGENENRMANELVGSWWIYQPWLDKLGLKMPTTYLEFENMLRAFKTKDPNGNGKADEYPFVFASGWSANSSLQNFFAMFGYGYKGMRDNSDSYVQVDNKAIFVPGTENFKEAVIWLHKLFAEGLLAE
jgi:putative aldouronate transport system substrate-binding protein